MLFGPGLLLCSSVSETCDRSRERRPVIFLETRIGSVEELPPRDDHYVDAIESRRVRSVPEHLSNETFGAIPPDRIAELLRGDNPKPRLVVLARRDEKRQESASHALTVVEDLLEFGPPPEPPALAELPGRRGFHVASIGKVRRTRSGPKMERKP